MSDPRSGAAARRARQTHARRALRLLAVFAPLAVAVCLAPSLVGAADDDGYSPEGANACLDCHENSGVLGIMDTEHADVDNPKTPAGQKQCQSCHGPSAKHMEFPMQVANLHFGEGSKVKPVAQNQLCLECHIKDEERADWKAGPHGFEHVLCSGCHSIHHPERIVPAEAEVVATCSNGGCHADLMNGKNPDSFTHAVGMELPDASTLTCISCHNPHGPLNSGRCGDCHEATLTTADMAKQSEKARQFHQTAKEKGTDCIRCHKGISHPIPPLEAAQAADPSSQSSKR